MRRLSQGYEARPSSVRVSGVAARISPENIILLAVTGMSPAVLTETVWALAFPTDRKTPAIIPDRVVALTTTVGREAIAQQLFGADTIWERLRQVVLGSGHKTDPRLCFGTTADCVKVFTTKIGGKPVELKDISTEDESAAVADFITDELWAHVEKPGTRLIASISGGFKTMSALLFAGMSLMGRKDDVITHVLVNAPYDTSLTPRFFFPAQPEQGLRDRDGKVWRAREAQLRLGFVPFVALNDLLEKYKKPRSYSDLVERCRGNLDRHVRRPVRLRLCVPTRRVELNGAISLRLAPQPFLFLWFLADRAQRAAPALGKYLAAMLPLQQFVQDCLSRWDTRQQGWIAPGKKLLPDGFSQSVAQHDDSPIRTRLLWALTEKLRQVPGAAILAVTMQ